MPLVASIPLFVSSGTGEALAGGARYFVAAVVLLGLSRVRLDRMLLLRAASASGLLAILFNITSLDQVRVDWGVGFLDSAYIGVMLLCLAMAQFHLDHDRPVWRIFGALGVAALVFVVVKTGARGAWPAMLLVLVLQFALLKASRIRKALIAVVGMVLVFAAAISMPSINQRIELTLDEIQTYYENGNRASSMGYRLDFWHIAMNSFRDSPIWGVSYQRRSELMDEFTEKYPQSSSIGDDGRSSSHNEVLNAMSKRGLLGAIAILLLYLVPLRYFAGLVKDHREPVRHLAMAGGACVLSMMVCGITEAPMMNVRVGTTFGFILIFLYHLIQLESARGCNAGQRVESG